MMVAGLIAVRFAIGRLAVAVGAGKAGDLVIVGGAVAGGTVVVGVAVLVVYLLMLVG